MQNGFEEAAAFGLGGGELRFQPVAEGQQFVDFGDDAELLFEGWEGDRHSLRISDIKMGLRGCFRGLAHPG